MSELAGSFQLKRQLVNFVPWRRTIEFVRSKVTGQSVCTVQDLPCCKGNINQQAVYSMQSKEE